MKKIKILVVDDDPLLSRLYEKAFSFDKYEVEIAWDGEVALTKVTVFKPHLMLLDIMMPRLNGLEVLARLREIEEMKKLPVIILTNETGSDKIEVARKFGVTDYIIKDGQTPAEMVAKVEEVIGKLNLI